MNDEKCTCWNPTRHFDVGCPQHRRRQPAEFNPRKTVTFEPKTPPVFEPRTDDPCCGGGCTTC